MKFLFLLALTICIADYEVKCRSDLNVAEFLALMQAKADSMDSMNDNYNGDSVENYEDSALYNTYKNRVNDAELERNSFGNDLDSREDNTYFIDDDEAENDEDDDDDYSESSQESESHSPLISGYQYMSGNRRLFLTKGFFVHFIEFFLNTKGARVKVHNT
jgi:hypothetical protein